MTGPRSILTCAFAGLLALTLFVLPASLVMHTAVAHAHTPGVAASCSDHAEVLGSDRDDEEDDHCEFCDLLTAKTSQTLVEGEAISIVAEPVCGLAVLAGGREVRVPPTLSKQSRAPPARA